MVKIRNNIQQEVINSRRCFLCAERVGCYCSREQNLFRENELDLPPEYATEWKVGFYRGQHKTVTKENGIYEKEKFRMKEPLIISQHSKTNFSKRSIYFYYYAYNWMGWIINKCEQICNFLFF